jgi:hypothetical protein
MGRRLEEGGKMFPHGAKAISIPIRQKAAFNVCYCAHLRRKPILPLARSQRKLPFSQV